MSTPHTLARLLSRIALRDRAAFDSLYDLTSAKLFGVVFRLLRERTDAEDALQDIYVKIWHRADRYSVSEASAMSWMIAIARNHAIDRLRARRRGHGPIDEATEIADAAPSPEANAVAGSERARIDTCLDRLEADRAQAVRGAYLDGRSYQELADRHEVPINTMRTWLRRSLKKLRECLEE
ncbi:MAG: sigma-70 family RNA polymerase sigma factor [Pseudomonadota bacterium]